MKTLAEYLELAAKNHGHICAGQVLGVRLAMLGLRELGIDDPVAERKRLVTYVEIDRCVTDAVAVVAHCRLGKRALKFRDWGKEIGRASCRERVEIWVVGGVVEKKKKRG